MASPVLNDSPTASSKLLRKRQLFPSNEESDDDTDVSPLSALVICENNEGSLTAPKKSISDYELLERIHASCISSVGVNEEKSDLYTNTEECSRVSMSHEIDWNETPILPKTLLSNCELLERIHDPCLSLANEEKAESGSTVSTSPARVVIKIVEDFTAPKFDAISTSSNENYKNQAKSIHEFKYNKARKINVPKLYLCGRNFKGRKHYGEINAGVRHSIKKAKPKKSPVVKEVKDFLGAFSAPLMQYLQDVKELACQPKQIQEIRKADELPQEFSEPRSYILSESNNNTLHTSEEYNRKRKGSPLSDVNKKFFKHRRTNATVTVDDHVKFIVGDGKLTLLENTDQTAKTFDSEMLEDEKLIPDEEVANIITFLSDGFENDDSTFKPYSSLPRREQTMNLNVLPLSNEKENYSTDENSILFSPTVGMCNMTSDLVLNSPKKAVCNLNNIIDKENMSMDSDSTSVKLYPIFTAANNFPLVPSKTNKIGSVKKLKPLPKDQMLLDAGQKKFGCKQCTECQFVYHMGDFNDELMHQNYHSAASVFRFGGWKDEQVMGQVGNAKIIRVLPDDPKPWIKKVKDLIDVVNRDLGYYEMDVFLDNTQIYLYITHKTIVGCLVAEPKPTGHRMLSSDNGIDLCEETSHPIKCGVSRIWVAQAHRKQGIGRALLNCLRANFNYGGILNDYDIAFSSPTAEGKAFAMKYFNTPNFLIYLS